MGAENCLVKLKSCTVSELLVYLRVHNGIVARHGKVVLLASADRNVMKVGVEHVEGNVAFVYLHLLDCQFC